MILFHVPYDQSCNLFLRFNIFFFMKYVHNFSQFYNLMDYVFKIKMFESAVGMNCKLTFLCTNIISVFKSLKVLIQGDTWESNSF